MKIQYLIHADFEYPGIIETWAEQNHFSQDFCRPFAGDAIPDPADFDLLIIMGGPQSPLATDQAPYLCEEISLIRRAVQKGVPILGFCLGAQLIGEALGGKTEHSPSKEVGVFPIHLTEDGKKDLLLEGLPFQFPVVHWHNDMPGLTETAVILATSEGCPRQIIRYLPLVYGFQCHLEPMKTNMEAMIRNCPEDLSPGCYVQTKEEILAADFDGMNETMIHILNRFISLIAHANS